MAKKLIVVLLIVCCACALLVVGYNNKPIEIVYLGDSIAEGIAGMSPISERERYSYYGLIGTRNEYIYRNRGVSGYKSSDLLKFIKKEDTGVKITQTLLKNADIIHVSILGNDLLLNDLGQIIVAAAQDDFTIINNIIERSRENFAEIVSVLKGYNPNAVIFFQNVYNPVFEYTWLINQNARNQLDQLGVQPSQYREYGGIILGMLNSIISDYLVQNPGAFYLMDSFAEFDRIYQENPARGKRLISVDCVHPSSEGHGVLADLTQQKLEELGLASKKKAVKNYKKIKKEQLERLYSDTVDVKAVSAQIDAADDCSKITEIFFEAIYNKIPKY